MGWRGGLLSVADHNNNNNNNKNNNNKKTTTTTTTKTTTTRNPQRQQQQQEKQPQHHQQQHTENNNHKNKNKTSSDHFLQTTGKDKNKTQKRTKNEPNCLQIAHGLKNRAEKRAHPPNAFTLQKQAFQKIKPQNFTKCTKKAFFFTRKYSSNWYMHYTAGQCDPKKHYFHKGNTPSDWNRARLSRAEIQVCVSTKLSSWLMGWAIRDFLPFCWLPHFSSEMPIFTVRNTRGPRTGS